MLFITCPQLRVTTQLFMKLVHQRMETMEQSPWVNRVNNVPLAQGTAMAMVQ